VAFLSLCLFALSGGETGAYPAGARVQFPFALVGLVAAWLAYTWTKQGHRSQGTLALLLAVVAQLVAIGIVVV
jgi:hypothetical protein